MNRHLSTLIVLFSVSGCGLGPGREASPHSAWMSSRYSSGEGAWVYRNFYSEFEDFDRCVGYAIVGYKRNSERDSKMAEVDLLVDSLRLCREEFQGAYLKGWLTRWDGNAKTLVPYAPKYVAVLMDDFSGRVDQVGIVVRADEVFSNAPITQIVEAAKVSRGRLWFEDISEEEKRHGYSPGKVIRYIHIEDHMRFIEGDSVNAEAVGLEPTTGVSPALFSRQVPHPAG